ncbi:MAG: sulfatase [Myxococcales bacterium]|nr:sulfatase [Myxococcales bacterium]
MRILNCALFGAAAALLPALVAIISLSPAPDGAHALGTYGLAVALEVAIGGAVGLALGAGLAVLGLSGTDLVAGLGGRLRPLRAVRTRATVEVLIWPAVFGAFLLAQFVVIKRFFAFNNPTLAALLLAVFGTLLGLAALRFGRVTVARLEGSWERLAERFPWAHEPVVVALGLVGVGLGALVAFVSRHATALSETLEAVPLAGPLAVLWGLVVVVTLDAASASRPALRRLRYVGLVAGALALGGAGLSLGSVTGLENAWLHEKGRSAATWLSVAEKVSDRDRDGFSPLFGHGDCNDHDKTAFPGSDLGDDCLPDEELLDRAAFEKRLHGRTRRPVTVTQAPVEKRVVAPSAPPAAAPAPPTAPPEAPPSEIASPPETPPSAAPPTAAPPEGRWKAPYNVILITIDTVRADHLGFAGYGHDTSPRLDALAKRGVVFEKAYAPSNMTPISIPALLTGRYTSELFRDDAHFIHFDEKNDFLAERLNEAGIDTRAVVTHWYFEKKKKAGLDQGFRSWKVVGTKWGKEMEDMATSHLVTDAGIAELGALPEDKPFFLWLHYLDPHKWYIFHDGFEKRFGTSSKDRYDHEIAYTDHHIGRFLDALGKRSDAGRTAVIVTSDHGEAFGEHGTAFHGFSIYEDQLRVPFVAHVPGVTDVASPAGATERRVQKRVGLIDLAPTIADLQGVAVEGMQGESLRPELLGEDVPQRLIYAERVRGPHSAGFRTLIDGDWKLIWRAAGNRFELYNLKDDPKELDDRISKNPTEATELRRALASMLEYALDHKDKVRAARD